MGPLVLQFGQYDEGDNHLVFGEFRQSCGVCQQHRRVEDEGSLFDEPRPYKALDPRRWNPLRRATLRPTKRTTPTQMDTER